MMIGEKKVCRNQRCCTRRELATRKTNLQSSYRPAKSPHTRLWAICRKRFKVGIAREHGLDRSIDGLPKLEIDLAPLVGIEKHFVRIDHRRKQQRHTQHVTTKPSF